MQVGSERNRLSYSLRPGSGSAVTEIAELNRRDASVCQRDRGDAHFPRPLGREGGSRLWNRQEVVAWAKVWRTEKPWR